MRGWPFNAATKEVTMVTDTYFMKMQGNLDEEQKRVNLRQEKEFAEAPQIWRSYL